MRRRLIVLILLPVELSAQSRARNVILFVADAGGTSTLAAASLHGYGAPRRLFIQRMPHIGLSDTTTASQIVSDSAAGMTAIVTGERTHNDVVAQSAGAVRGKIDGEPLKTILEYAEERGLSTGIITNDSPAGATLAALYAKVNNRTLTAVIFQQLFAPRFDDGVDVVIAGGRGTVAKALAEAGLEPERRANLAGRETLLVFTADHSFDIQLRGGLLGQPLLEGLEKAEEENPKGPIRIPAVRMGSGHG